MGAREGKIPASVTVGVSCGKDSVAALDIAVSRCNRVSAFFLYMVEGLDFQERYLRYLEKRYQVKIVRLPHWELGRILRRGWYRPHSQVAQKCKLITISDIETEVRNRTGIDWIAYGSRVKDNLWRQGRLKRFSDGMDHEKRIWYPLLRWPKKAVLRYLSLKCIPLAPEYKYINHSFVFDSIDIRIVKEKWPNDYKKIEKAFPFIGAICAREVLYPAHKKIRDLHGRIQPKKDGCKHQA